MRYKIDEIGQQYATVEMDNRTETLYARENARFSCYGCYFLSSICKKGVAKNMYCSARYRKDKKNIIWCKAIDFTGLFREEESMTIKNKMDNVERFKSITQRMADTYEKKNADYGDSFSQSLEEFGLVAGIVRIGDKFNRIKRLSKSDAQVKEESLKDTLLDMADYAVMTLMYLEQKDE